MTKYPSDLTQAQFVLIAKYFPNVKSCRPRKYTRLDIVNAILYRLKTSCPWRYLPKEYPEWRSVYRYYAHWVKRKVIQYIEYELNKLSRVGLKRNRTPSVLIIDSQSIKNSHIPSTKPTDRDGHKKVKGIKRFILCDTCGFIWKSLITPANVSEKTGARILLSNLAHTQATPSSIHTVVGDKGFESKSLREYAQNLNLTFNAMKSTTRYKLTSHKIGIETNKNQLTIQEYINKNISSIRWIVERDFAWFGHFRLLGINYNRKHEHHQADMSLAMISIMLRRVK
jgi:putative transposase